MRASITLLIALCTACSQVKVPPAMCEVPDPPAEATTTCQKACGLPCASPDASCIHDCLDHWRELHACIECVTVHGCDATAACTELCSSCGSDADCKNGQACSHQGSCVDRQCTTGADCPCIGACHDGQCDPPECLTNGDCPRSEICKDQVCTPQPCHVASDCGTHWCDTGLGTCYFAACRLSYDCTAAETCDTPTSASSQRFCLPRSCHRTGDCPDRTRCASSGYCVP